MFWFIVLLLLAGAGFYFYQKLMKIEREIRAEQEAEAARATAAKAQQPVKEEARAPVTKVSPAKATPAKATPTKATPTKATPTKAAAPAEEASKLESQIVAAVTNQPGLKQTELYAKFADINKKQLQQVLKEMADTGTLKREKKGSSYLVFPA